MPGRARARRSRHGRELRSSVAGPVLPYLSSRETRFEDAELELLRTSAAAISLTAQSVSG